MHVQLPWHEFPLDFLEQIGRQRVRGSCELLLSGELSVFRSLACERDEQQAYVQSTQRKNCNNHEKKAQKINDSIKYIETAKLSITLRRYE